MNGWSAEVVVDAGVGPYTAQIGVEPMPPPTWEP